MNKFTAPRQPSITQKWIFHKLLLQILNSWKWIVLVVIISISIAFSINRYSSKVYRTSIEVVKGGTEISGPEAASLFGGGMESNQLNLKYERAFITSLPIMKEVVKNLDLQVSYFSKGRVKTTERFGYVPLKVHIYEEGTNTPYNVQFIIHAEDAVRYYLTTENEKWQEIFINKRFKFGEKASIGDLQFMIEKLNSLETGDWIFMVQPLESVAQKYQGSIGISEIREGSSWGRSSTSMLLLSMQGTLPHLDRILLNQLVEVLKSEDIKRKIEQSERTIRFIESQLFQITDSMKIIAAQMRSLKLSNKELTAGSSAVFGKITNLEEEKTRLLLENRYCDYLETYIKEASDSEIMAPSTFGISNDILGGFVSQYIELKLDQQEIANLNLESSIFIRELKQMEDKAEQLESLMLKSIENTQYANELRIKESNNQIQTLFTSARSVLSEEIIYTDFERLYGLNEKVFTMLMDKKAEAGITQASMISDYRIFEAARTSYIPLKPLGKRNYITALFLGLLIPIGFLLIRTLNKNTILSLTELEELVNLPVAGVIGFSPNTKTIIDTPQSLVAENFRSLRSNLRFVNSDKDQTVFVVTSSVSAEGKTFISANLGAAMALQGKKTVIVGADMRKPTLNNYFTESAGYGLSEYLIGKASLSKVIQSGGADNLDIIFSGHVPPNPAELLSGKRMNELVDDLKEKYDIVFIDTPPIGLITDASEIFDIADSILLVTRQQQTPVSTLQHADHFMDEQSLSKSMLIFNGVRKGFGYGYYGYGYGYGNGYGYGYYTEDKTGKRQRRHSRKSSTA